MTPLPDSQVGSNAPFFHSAGTVLSESNLSKLQVCLSHYGVSSGAGANSVFGHGAGDPPVSSQADRSVSSRSRSFLTQEIQRARTYQGRALRKKWNISRPWKSGQEDSPNSRTHMYEEQPKHPRKPAEWSGPGKLLPPEVMWHSSARIPYLGSRLFGLAGSSGGLRWDPLFRRSTRPCCCGRRRRGKAQDGGQNARRISEGQFEGNFLEDFISQWVYHCHLGAYRRFWPAGGDWGGIPCSGHDRRPGPRRTVVRRLRGLVSPLSPSLDSARDWRAQGGWRE